MRSMQKNPEMIFVAGLIFACLFFPLSASGQQYPTKPITIYCGMEAGATTDLTARALAEAGQKRAEGPGGCGK